MTYNPFTNILNCDIGVNASALFNPSFATSTMTINCAFLSMRTYNYIFTGTTNILGALVFPNSRNNGFYNIGILNNGSGTLTINTALGTNIKTVYSTPIAVPTLRFAMMTMNSITINSVQTYIVNAVLLTN